MTYDRMEEAKEVAVFGLAGFALWLVWYLLHNRSAPVSGNADAAPVIGPPEVVPGSISPVVPLSQTAPASAGCDCSTGCANNPYVVPGLAQIQAQTVAYTNAIIAAGNSTLEALANIANTSDPFLTVDVSSPGG